MSCGSYGVAQVLVGLHRVGVIGLHDALKRAGESKLGDREAVLDLLMEILASKNYVPESMADAYRTAIWREYLRFEGEDFSEFYSEVEVTVSGNAGEERDLFVEMLESVFAEFELKPLVTFEAGTEAEPQPRLAIGDHVIVAGEVTRERFKTAVRRTLSDW